jgi:hypothetical protein
VVSHSASARRHFKPAGKSWWLIALVAVAILATVAASAAAIQRPAGAAAGTATIYSTSQKPAVVASDDAKPLELGVRFTVRSAGAILAIRYYKSSRNTGTHTGTLWTASGQRLASVTFTSQSKSGWQQANLAQPIAVTPGITYVASYLTTSGHYSYKQQAFARGSIGTSKVLRGTAGVYHYGSGVTFPTQTWNHTSFYVDVVFAPGAVGSPGTTAAPIPTVSTVETPTVAPVQTSTTPVKTTTPAPSTTHVSSPAPQPTAVPAACAAGGSYLWAHLDGCGWAGPGNTGPDTSNCPGGALTTNSGAATRQIKVTAPNTVISCENITGCLQIDAQNVTVRDVQIACSSGKTGEAANGTAPIFVNDGASAIVDRVAIDGMDGTHACIWHQGTSLSVDAISCANVDDGIFSWADTSYSSTTGNNFTIKNSYFHDFTTKTSNGHIDGYQTEGAANGTISHNTYYMNSDNGNKVDSAIAIWDSLKNSSNITVSNNLIAGGGFSMYAEDYSPSESNPAGGFTVTGIVFTGNKFSTVLFGCVGYYGVWFPRGAPDDGWHRSGNSVLETGADVDSSNPTYHGSSCS